jgi:protein phosphatase
MLFREPRRLVRPATPFTDHGKLNDFILEIVMGRVRGDALDPRDVRRVIRLAAQKLRLSWILLRLAGDFVVVGDIHGNLDDLLRIFEAHGWPPHRDYLFRGDYIDRGRFSIEVLLLIYALYVKCPRHVRLLRGNHETKASTTMHGFRPAGLVAFSKTEYRLFLGSFSFVPIAAVMNEKVLCVHGGVSPFMQTLAELERDLLRPLVNLSSSAAATDILWSDPSQRHRSSGPTTGESVGSSAPASCARSSRGTGLSCCSARTSGSTPAPIGPSTQPGAA